MPLAGFEPMTLRVTSSALVVNTSTPGSNLTYLASPGQFFIGAKLFPGVPCMRKKSSKINLFGLCENACFTMATRNVILKNGGVPTKSIIS